MVQPLNLIKSVTTNHSQIVCCFYSLVAHLTLGSFGQVVNGVLGFPEIAIKKKPQRNFQTDFYVRAQGRQPRGEEGPLNRVGGWPCLAALISWGQSGLV